MCRTFLYFIIAILASLGAFYYVNGEIKAFSKEIDIFTSKQAYYNLKTFEDKIIVETPKTGQVITSPIKISGSVSGTWFFEGEILGKIIDTDGTILGQGPLVGTDDWMTIKNVGFEGVIPFVASDSKNGFVIIEARDPSGEGNPSSFKIPVLFEDASLTACVGDSCGECTIGSAGTNGVCVHNSATKNL